MYILIGTYRVDLHCLGAFDVNAISSVFFLYVSIRKLSIISRDLNIEKLLLPLLYDVIEITCYIKTNKTVVFQVIFLYISKQISISVRITFSLKFLKCTNDRKYVYVHFCDTLLSLTCLTYT